MCIRDRAMTVYAFSTENFKREASEVEYIFKLPKEFFNLYLKELMENNVQIRYIGHLEMAPIETQNIITVSYTHLRVLLKLSGEALAGEQGFGINPVVVADVARQIKDAKDLGVEIAIGCGGGNIWRGKIRCV